MTISFDRADASAKALPCAQCGHRIDDHYWTWQARAFCSRCRDALASTFAKTKSKAAFAKAVLRGGGVALGCGVAYALFVHFTNFQLSLITIGIGIVVAKAVRAASSNVGGTRYQVLAVALTYAASTMGYAPAIATGIKNAIVAPAPAQGSASAEEGAEAKGSAPAKPIGLREAAAAIVMLVASFVGLVLAAPFLEITEAPLGLLIVGFGLLQAWKLTKGVPTEMSGPYALAASTRSP
jgi:hypothetical protein